MTRLRVATWNMHGGVGLDGRFAPARVAQVVGELDADVVALQEFGSRLATFDMRAHLESAGTARAIVMPTFQKHGCDFGNVVLTRWPARDVACHAIGVDRREPRNAIDLVVDHGGGSLRVVASHFGLRGAERATQIERLLALFDAADARPTVLLGDFNEWRPRSALRRFDRHFGMALAPATFPSPFPVSALDRIWVAPADACVGLRAHRSRAARVASDHLPLVATLELP
jgi:endonuclease/exonuclease/phosphatase family metal-dependent hydrolase